jgi:uncharacterized protein YkwD
VRSAVALALFLAPQVVSGTPARAPLPLSWANATESPQGAAADALTDRQADLLARCGTADAALVRVAARVVERKVLGLPFLDTESVTFAQRVEGEPHVWPRAWAVSGRALDHEATRRKLETWRASFRDLGERRCGVASGVAPDGTQIVAAIALDALADLDPLPTRAHAGQWLEVSARLLVPATSARVVVLGPGGEPRRVPTLLEGSRVRARFAPDRPGAFTVQIVADVATGPRPILEARVFADAAPPSEFPSLAAPGEDAGDAAADSATQLAGMVAALRSGEGLGRIAREAGLDALAAAHAKHMLDARAVGHDVGDGEPVQRLQSAGIPAREAGENVAHAATLKLAHRALWQSPSHRANLLRADFLRAGFGVAADPDGSVWVCEMFAR